MTREFKIYKDKNGHRVLEIHTLAFISDRNHRLGWFGLHYRHFSIKILLKWADKVYVPDCSVAVDLVKYYFYPKERIVVDRTRLADKKSK
jgi:hypothetical protein